MGAGPFATHAVGDGLVSAYRELVQAEARLVEEAGGVTLASSVADRWPALRDYLDLYARHLSPAGIVVFGGGPDAGSRFTGIPFTGPRAARERLGVQVPGEAISPAEAAFWDAVTLASPIAGAAPLESLFATVHLTLARPFDAPQTREVLDASARHALRILAETRPQAAVAVGADSLLVLARALCDGRVDDLAALPEASWARHWPPGTRLLQYPYVEVPVERPFRLRLVPVPSLDGPHAEAAVSALGGVLAYAWAV